MQIRKTYTEVNPELLYAEIRDFILQQGASLAENKLETYTLPNESAAFISRGTMTFKTSESNLENIRVHLVGSARAETKLMIDVDERFFGQDKLSVLMNDLNFIFGAHETE
jgi:hypothetical protein